MTTSYTSCTCLTHVLHMSYTRVAHALHTCCTCLTHAGTLCGSCGNGTIVTVLRMLCRDDCLWDKGFYITVTVFSKCTVASLHQKR